MKRSKALAAVVVLGVSAAAGTLLNMPSAAQDLGGYADVSEFVIDPDLPKTAVACIECHRSEHPGLVADWYYSQHAQAGVTCLNCHEAQPGDPDVSQGHAAQYQREDQLYGKEAYRVPVTAVVTPQDCAGCHPDETDQYARSKHARTIEIIWKVDAWLKDGMNSPTERATGCFVCHGSVVRITDGRLDPGTWPNVGVGRVNPDGTLGSCTGCHTRHRFSIMEARKPEACGSCHLGPDHPQIEIYMESKHGDLYTAFGGEYNWEAETDEWQPGTDYRGPTCASCHMSGAGTVGTTHDCTERLSWELQAPLTVRPEAFAALPAQTQWQVERDKMKTICGQCHAPQWVDNHFDRLDSVVHEYDEVYFKPAKALLDDLYARSLLDSGRFFDEPLEVEYYELWHHEGRRARMGAAMMAPDYTWWHGFYELKKRSNGFMHEGRELIAHGEKSYKATDFPNATGETTPPAGIPSGRR